MPLSRILRLAVLGAPCGALAVGCAMPKPPGDLVGSYHVEGALTVNECGEEALPAIDPLSFDVQIRRDDRSGYWLPGMPPAWPGKLGEDGAFSFELRQTYAVPSTTGSGTANDDVYLDSDPEAVADPARFERREASNRAACQLTITETIEGSVLREASPGVHRPPGDGDPDLVGENVIAIAATAGDDCSRVMRTSGGPFEQLPCRARYDLIGQLVEDDED